MADHLPLALRIGESIADLISIGQIEAVAARGRRLRAALAAVLVADNVPELRLVQWLDPPGLALG